MIELYDTKIGVALHAGTVLFREVLVQLDWVLRCFETFVANHAQGVPDHLLIVTNVNLAPDDVVVDCSVIQIVDFGCSALHYVGYLACLHWEKVSSEYHLTEACVVHMLNTCQLLSAVHI